MASSTINHAQGGNCVLWTPWGPQAASESKPQISSLRRTLRKLTPSKARKQARDTLHTKPECAYEP